MTWRVEEQLSRWDSISSAVGWGCMGCACDHGCPNACWGLQRSLWLSYARAGDWAFPVGLRSCKWNLCVYFGRNWVLPTGLFKINQGNITEETSLGNKLSNYLKFSKISMSPWDSQAGPSQHTLSMANEGWRSFFPSWSICISWDYQAWTVFTCVNQGTGNVGLWHSKKMKMGTNLMPPLYTFTW